MTTPPFFSVITPTFDREQYLPDTIRTVQEQVFENYEHIIVDDGSTDGTEELVTAFAKEDPRIILIVQTNKGRSTARNVGIEKATGDYICFLDSDDLWKENHLENLHVGIGQNAPPAFYHTGLIWQFDQEARSEEVAYRPRTMFTSDVEYVIANEFAPDCVCIHHSILGKHRFNPTLYINEDLELWARIAAENTVMEIQGRTAVLRVHAGNTLVTEKDTVTPRRKVFEMQVADPSVRSQLSPQFIRDRERGLSELWIRQLEKTGNRWQLCWALLRFLSRYPRRPGNLAKLVALLYALPGGGLLRWLARTKKTGEG